jgi:hypothetical protein
VLMSYLLTGTFPFPTEADAIAGHIVLPGPKQPWKRLGSCLHLEPNPQLRADIREVRGHEWLKVLSIACSPLLWSLFSLLSLYGDIFCSMKPRAWNEYPHTLTISLFIALYVDRNGARPRQSPTPPSLLGAVCTLNHL